MFQATQEYSVVTVSRFLLSLDISAVSRFSTASRSSPGAISPFSSFIGRPPESLLKGFSLRVSVLPKVSRLLHLKSRDSCCLSISLRPRGLRQAPYLHFHLSSLIFHRTPARKFPERLSFPGQRTPRSFLRGFSLRVSVLPKVSRLRLLKSRDSHLAQK